MNLDTSLNTAEGAQEGMVAPGQESLLADFVQEQEAAQEQAQTERLLGKFNSTEDLAKAYQQLERKLGQRGSGVEEDSDEEDAEEGDYEEGEETDEDYEEEDDDDSSYEMSEEEVSSIMDMVGGKDAFNQISQWAKQNLQPDLLDEYNDAVSAGNVEAIRWAVRAIAVQAMGAGNELVEPELIGSGKPETALQFESQAQVLEAMNKKNDRGQRLYDVDEAYRGKVQKALMRSDVF